MSVRLWLLILVGFGVGVFAALGAALALGGDDAAPAPLVAVQAPPQLTPTQVPELTATPEPPVAAAVEPSRIRSCEEIRAGGAYEDDVERQRFLTECGGPAIPSTPRPGQPAVTPRPATPALAVPTSPSAPLPDISGRIELIGAVWPDEALPVRYCVNVSEIPVRSNGARLMSDEAFAGMVRTAFATWESIPESRIAFAYQGICASDPWNNRDGVNTVGWGWLFGNAIGLADPSGTNGRFLRQNSTGQLFEVDLVIDIRFAQSFSDPTDYLQRQLPHIILHEAGHFLGLGHATEACSVMRPSGIGSGLCWVDIAAAAQLYPR